VAVINRNAARLTRTVEHLMHVALARQGRVPLSRRPVDLAELVGRCVRRRPEGGDRIVVRAPDTAVVVAVDARQLTRAVDNLLANACLFGAADAPVTVTVTAGRGACVDVRDHGPGIAPDELAHVGTPFFRGVRARAAQLPGLGLGLAVTRQIMQAHGGDVAVASAVGRGTHTRLRLAG
jgi:signal transduction histidine kinase